MNWTLLINMVASAAMVVGFTAFLIFLFGRQNSLIHRLGGMHAGFVKVALSACAAGALLNLLTLSEPPPSEMLLNIGIALLFVWAAWFHWTRFVRGGARVEQKAAKRAPRRRKSA
jgi:hypothetical protein